MVSFIAIAMTKVSQANHLPIPSYEDDEKSSIVNQVVVTEIYTYVFQMRDRKVRLIQV